MSVARHSVIRPPAPTVKELPPPREVSPSALQETLEAVEWRRVPAGVMAEIRYILELRCRKTAGECFCGEHSLSFPR